MFENSPDTIDLFDNLIQLDDDGAEPRHGGPASRWTLGACHADSDRSVHADVWERHPTGQEVLITLSGRIHVHLRDHDPAPVAVLTAGRSFIVPAGRWHRLAVAEAGDLITITPRAGTEHERTAA